MSLSRSRARGHLVSPSTSITPRSSSAARRWCRPRIPRLGASAPGFTCSLPPTLSRLRGSIVCHPTASSNSARRSRSDGNDRSMNAPVDRRARKHHSLRRNAVLTLGALGVVFGDIGTSPLYAMRETALAAGGGHPGADAIMGAVSLIFWARVIVVTVKYVIFIMQADNDG